MAEAKVLAVGIRYTADDLLFLRQSPLCVKPPGLPPPEEWMGPPPETSRGATKTTNDRVKSTDNPLLEPRENRRPTIDRNASRNNANPEDIILGPPRTNFASSTSMRSNKPGENEKSLKDGEPRDRAERFNFRNRTNDSDNVNDRFRDTRNNNNNNSFRRRGETDQDNDGWSTVKPRKSFGHEGAERFHGRMGGAGGDRFAGRDDRRVRERDDRENADRRNRNIDQHSRDKDAEEEGQRRNGLGRGRSDPWFKEDKEGAPLTQRERIDRAKSWRDRDPDDHKPSDKHGDRPTDRSFDRRWDRDREQRVDRDPEWLDEPAEQKSQGRTEEDLKKWMEAMRANRNGPQKTEEKAPEAEKPAPESVPEPEQKTVSAPPVESGPDKFFAAYGGAGLDVTSPAVADAKEGAKAKGGKSSRFTSFFTAQEERGKTEPPMPATVAPPPPPPNGTAAQLPQQNDAEKEAFQILLQKLQRQTLGQTLQSNVQSHVPPQPTPTFAEHSSTPAMHQPKSVVASPDPFQQYGGDNRRDDPRHRATPHSVQDILSPRPMAPPVQPPPAPRPEQTLQDLLQRHHIPVQSNTRMEQNPAAVNNNTEFLMRLMQSARNAPEPPRTEQLMVRMPQPTKQVNLANLPDRDSDYQRERGSSQRHMRTQGPPVFMDEPYHPQDNDSRPQPTQILQRPPPPGLDHHMSPFPIQGQGQMPPQRPMIPPPPGLLNNSRNVPNVPNVQMPGMFPPNFPPGAFAPPEAMVGPPGVPGHGPRPMQPPPGFYGGPPPHGFGMPHPSMVGYPGPESLGYGGPFDGRGMPPPGAGAAYRRQ